MNESMMWLNHQQKYEKTHKFLHFPYPTIRYHAVVYLKNCTLSPGWKLSLPTVPYPTPYVHNTIHAYVERE